VKVDKGLIMRTFLHQCRSSVASFAALAAVSACSRGGSPISAASAEAGGRHTAPTKPAASTAASVMTNARPADACGWLTVPEVETIVGKLTGPPHLGDEGCVYPLPVDSATARQRAEALAVRRKLEERFGKSDMPEPTPDESGVIVDVQIYADPAGTRATNAASAVMAGWLKDETDTSATPAADSAPVPTLPGWDATNDPTARSFHGRVGYMQVDVVVQAAEVSRDQAVAVADRIRGKVADLPFPSERSGMPSTRDPCALVTAQEAEQVLGELVVPPYRSDDGTPLAVDNGNSCSYLTAGHHALVLKPTWTRGGTAYKAATGVGGLVERIAPALHVDAADTLDKGPWEEAGANSTTGELYFLKGDRFLEIGYLASTTDMNGAVRLARIALGRL
jgi:hypothetical protein